MLEFQTLKYRMSPEEYLLGCAAEMMAELPVKIRIIRLSVAAWNDLRGCLPFFKQCPVFNNVLMLNELFVCATDDPLPLGPEFVDSDGNVFFHPDFSSGSNN